MKVFAIKPFECESDRRSLADRTLARLHFIDAFVEQQQHGHASLQILDNEVLARTERSLPIARIDRYWGEIVARLIERELIHPAETVLNAERMRALARAAPSVSPIPLGGELAERDPLIPVGPRLAPVLANPNPDGVELTIEVLPSTNLVNPP